MHSTHTLDEVTTAAARGLASRFAHSLTWIGLLTLLCVLAMPARAVDGCKVLLCLAAPSWRSIPEW